MVPLRFWHISWPYLTGGADYAYHITTCTPGFSDLRTDLVYTGPSQAGGRGGTCHPFLADQLTLSQPGGHIILTQYYVHPWIFRSSHGPSLYECAQAQTNNRQSCLLFQPEFRSKLMKNTDQNSILIGKVVDFYCTWKLVYGHNQ